MLFISRKAMCRRTLPMPDRNKFPLGEGVSSETIFCVRTRDRGRVFGVIAPALKLKSVRKDSRSLANLYNAESKSKSSENRVEARRGDEAPLTVILLRLLLVLPFVHSEALEKVESR